MNEIKHEFREMEELICKINFYVSLRARDLMLMYGLNGTQFAALEVIFRMEDISTGDLTKKLGYALSSMTDIIKKLTEKGFITRYRDEKDKRIYRCRITKKGKELTELSYFTQADYYFGLCRDFTEAEMDKLLQLLRKMENRIDEAIL